MGYARKDVEKTKKLAKKFVRYQEGAELYSIKEKCKALGVLMKVQTGEEHEIDDKMASAVNVVKIDVESYTAKACIR